ncbi:MAG: VCBS repeat-containing protein [Verrucomicrobia bacterium]|nr:VCBS repeat-containing protein [Verrucomicrobiota bacterium]
MDTALPDKSFLPNLARATDGTVFCAFVDLKAVWLCRCRDAGKTWSKPVKVMECPREGYIADPNILPVGTQVSVFATFVPSPYPPFAKSETLVSSSADDGASWSLPARVSMPHKYVSGKVHVPIWLDKKTVAMGYSWDVPAEEGKPSGREATMHARCGVLLSGDGGKIWTRGGDISIPPSVSTAGADEPAIVKLKNGDLFAIVRTSTSRPYETRSRNGGLIWEEPMPSRFYGFNSPACLLRLNDGSIVRVWDNSATNRYPLVVSISADEARTWSVPRTIAEPVMDKEQPSFKTACYPSAAQADDGTIVLSWWETSGAGSNVRMARFNRAWVEEEKKSAVIMASDRAVKLRAEERRNITPEWAVPTLRYRVLVEVAPADLDGRSSDESPACLDLDRHSQSFAPLKLRQPIDLDSIQVIRYDSTTGKTLPGLPWPFSRTTGERASRFLDKSLPWDFPTAGAQTVSGEKVPTFPRGAFLNNIRGNGNPGLLVWEHTQDSGRISYYAVYFNALKKGQRQKAARQGFIGDGSPRRDITDSSLTGTLYNRVTVEDWDGDGLPDLLIGGGFGYILLYRNEGKEFHPKFTQGEYLLDADGNILNAGGMSSPCVADWNADGKKDLLVGIEGAASLVWYENVGDNKHHNLVYRGYVKADGKEIVVPAKPCPESPQYTHDYAPSVEVVDWNGDGKPDLLLGGYITGLIWFYENIGTNSDGTPKLTFRGPLEADGKPLDTIWGAHPCAVDLNGDEKLDLLSGSFGQSVGGGDTFHKFLLYYENIGTRTHPKLTEKPVRYESEEPHEILAQARVLGRNRRGLTDLVISTFSKVYFAENVGTKRTPRWKLQLLEAPWGISPLSATQLMDLNGDGLLDLIISPLDSQAAPTVRLNQGKGPHGVFGPPQALLPLGQEISHRAPYGDQWAFVYLYDFEGDGNLDLLWAGGPGNVYLHRNRGKNKAPDYDTKGEMLMLTNGSPIKVGPPVVPINQIKDFTMMQGARAGVTAFDFNGDGKTDVVVGDTYGDIFYFENVGTNEKPTFTPGAKLGNIGSRAIPLTYDWDRDGRKDIIGVSASGQMEWYRNLGPVANPRFGPPQKLTIPPTVMYSPRLVIGDWDGDGDDDILVMSSYPWFCWLDGSYIQHGYARGHIFKVEARP